MYFKGVFFTFIQSSASIAHYRESAACCFKLYRNTRKKEETQQLVLLTGLSSLSEGKKPQRLLYALYIGHPSHSLMR